MNNQQGQPQQQPPYQQVPPQQPYQPVPPYQQPSQYQQAPYGYQQQPYQQYQQPYQPVYQQPNVKPTYLTTGWKVIYVILGLIAPIVSLLVAFIRSHNSPMGDAELREAMRYTLIGFLSEIILAIVIVIFGLSAVIGIAALM